MGDLGGVIILFAIVLIGGIVGSLWKKDALRHNIIMLCIVAAVIIGICILLFGAEKTSANTILGTVYYPEWLNGIFALLIPFAPVLYLIPIGIVVAIIQWITYKVKKNKKQ